MYPIEIEDMIHRVSNYVTSRTIIPYWVTDDDLHQQIAVFILEKTVDSPMDNQKLATVKRLTMQWLTHEKSKVIPAVHIHNVDYTVRSVMHILRRDMAVEMLNYLDESHRHCIELNYGFSDDMSLSEIGQLYDISRETVRQKIMYGVWQLRRSKYRKRAEDYLYLDDL